MVQKLCYENDKKTNLKIALKNFMLLVKQTVSNYLCANE